MPMDKNQNSTGNELRARLVVLGFEDSNEITKMIQIEPTRVLSKGDRKFSVPGQPDIPAMFAEENVWILESTESNTSNIESHIRNLVDRLMVSSEAVSK